MKAVVMAGGEGSRLRPLTLHRPKPLVPVVNKPVMQHILELLVRHGIRDIVVTLHYLAEEIEEFFGAAKEQYASQGIIDTKAVILDMRPVTVGMTLVDVRWPYLDRRGNEVGAETSTYLLRRVDSGTLKVQAAITHGVMASVVP